MSPVCVSVDCHSYGIEDWNETCDIFRLPFCLVNIETIRGKVYLAGITSRPDQLEILINIVKSVKGVEEVVNYVVVKE